ncbi:MAG: hypothetical protein JO016_08840 [Actinobacteria bacterium]|nr:hypothetical protein [Actinomycetota bacterium]
MELRLIPDRAIGEASLEAKDGLGFETYAKVLARAARGTPGPFTIGVFGEWGVGKTSLMRLVQADLAPTDNVVTVWFNAWRFEKEEHPIVPLVGTIIQELEKYRSRKEKLKDSTRGLIRALRAVAYGFSAKSTVKVPGFAEVEASFVAKDMIDRQEQIAPDPLLDRSLYYGAFNALEAIDLPADLRIVVLIDDLDRCFPDQAIRLLESIKLVLAQRGFIFVLGVARQVIEGYLQHRYSSDYGIKDFKGQLYLDKIVQLPFHIPPNAGRMDEFCARVLDGQPPEISSQLGATLPTIAEALGGNPRAVIRFINNILVDMAISSELTAVSSMEQIPLDFFAISRCLEHRWPEVYSSLTAADYLAEEVSSWQLPGLVRLAEGTDPKARIAASMVSDQKLARLLLSDRGRAWLSDSGQRTASVGFLQKERQSSQAGPDPAPRYDTYMYFDAADRAEVISLTQLLSAQGVDVFFDVEGTPVSSRLSEISPELAKSRSVCVCIGPNPLNVARVSQVDLLLRIGPDRVIPILLPGSDLENLPASLATFPVEDFSSGVHPSKIVRLAGLLLRST